MGLKDNILEGDHKERFEIILDTHAYYKEMVESLSHKIRDMRVISQSPSENHIVTLSYHKIVKIKDVYDGENLIEMPKDEGFNLPPSALYQEKSIVLEEKCNLVNVGTSEAPQITFYLESLLMDEQEVLKAFLIDKTSPNLTHYIVL
jgi:hypothetical protein